VGECNNCATAQSAMWHLSTTIPTLRAHGQSALQRSPAHAQAGAQLLPPAPAHLPALAHLHCLLCRPAHASSYQPPFLHLHHTPIHPMPMPTPATPSPLLRCTLSTPYPKVQGTQLFPHLHLHHANVPGGHAVQHAHHAFRTAQGVSVRLRVHSRQQESAGGRMGQHGASRHPLKRPRGTIAGACAEGAAVFGYTV